MFFFRRCVRSTADPRPSSAPSSPFSINLLSSVRHPLFHLLSRIHRGQIVTVTNPMCTSLLVSLPATPGKQLLNRYLRNPSGSMIERFGHALPELPNAITKTATHHNEHEPPSQYAGYCSPSQHSYRPPSETQANFISIKIRRF